MLSPHAKPQQDLERCRPGTLRGRGGDSRPPRKSGPPGALEIPRAPRNAARLPGNQEKTSAFFFFWHSNSPLPPLAPSSQLSPPRGAPPHGAPPSSHRQPTAAPVSLAFVFPPIGREDGPPGPRPYCTVYKWRCPRPRVQIIEAEDSRC